MHEELKDLIHAKMDVHEFLDFIEMDFRELLDYLDLTEHEQQLWLALG